MSRELGRGKLRVRGRTGRGGKREVGWGREEIGEAAMGEGVMDEWVNEGRELGEGKRGRSEREGRERGKGGKGRNI